jgi:hypothetical protein
MLAVSRKPVWQWLKVNALNSFVGRQYIPLTPLQALTELRSRQLGVARLRLVPKQKGVDMAVKM